MNLSEALDAALPEIPQARLVRSKPPQLDPDLVVHETTLDGEPIIGVLKRGKNNYYRLSPSQWELTQLFDGNRSYAEIAETFTAATSIPMDAEDVRGFAESMDESEFWYQTHQEKNLAMRDKLLAQRERRAKAKFNVAHISFSAWDPDRYFDWLNAVAGRFIYSWWCVATALLLFIVEGILVVQNWSSIGRDTATLFTFSEKGFGDLARFWVLILIVGFIHESAHGLTCKHYGGQVHSMGLMFLYLAPCFFVDVSESWVTATKVQRLATIIAGIWIELVVCGIAMIFWLNSPSVGWFHGFMYEFILLTGIAAVVINLNPLIKLDGYYFLTEIIEIPELKERSTAFLSGWFQAKVLRMPVEVPVVPRRRVALFVIYALLSGAYSYGLLLIVVRFSYRVGTRWLGEFALLPAAALAYMLFRSRLRSLRRAVMQAAREWMNVAKRWRTVHGLATAIFIVLLALSFVPLWRDREDAYFVVEPGEVHAICAAVPGRVNAVLVHEGEQVRAGEPLLQMTSRQAEAMHSSAVAGASAVRYKTFGAQLAGESIGAAAAEQVAARRMSSLASEANSSRELTAPGDGTILTENPGLLLYQDVGYGQRLLELAEGGKKVRAFIPTTALRRVPPGAEIGLALPGRFVPLRLRLGHLEPDPVTLPAGIVESQKYKGLTLPVFYTAIIPLSADDSNLMYGLSGQAIVFGERRSIAGRVGSELSDIIKRRVWW